MKIFTQIGHDKKATQWPALLILEILFNVVLSNIKKGAQGSLFYYLLYQLYRLRTTSTSLNFMFNLAKKFLKIYDFYKKSNKINGVYILDYVHKSLILKAFINFDKN